MKFLSLLTAIFLSIIGFNLLTSKVEAVTFTYPNYDVNIQINKDSTFVVTEEAEYILNGEAHGLRRDLTLYSSERSQRCIDNPNLTCGGFDRIQVISVKDNTGRELTDSEFDFFEIESGSTRSARFQWTIWEDGKNVTDYKVGWTIQYKVFGGIQNIGTDPYFYWNMLPENRGGLVSSSKLTINLPEGVTYNSDNLSVFTNYTYTQQSTQNSLTLNLKNLSSFGNFTLGYKFNPGDIILPGNIAYKIEAPEYGVKTFLDGKEVGDSTMGVIRSVESGDHLLEIKHIGYQTYSEVVKVESGKTITITTSLQPETWMQVLLFLNNIFIVLGCLFVPAAAIFAILYYLRKGRDKNMPKTIIPLYSPPKDVPPYLLGSIKDEQVDRQDIVGSIIDLAYRGFLKIKELKKDKNYEMTRITTKDESELNPTEKELLNALFNGAEVKETKDMKYYFPSKYTKLSNSIYKEMVDRKYFDRSPKTTIGMYFGIGFFLLISGGASIFILTPILTTFLGYISIFTLGAAIATLGFFFIIFSKFMPAKTELGSKVFADILGFKMYLNTAERYRLQNLGPEEFERYLSYAIVFGIEKEWAKKFEGIYEGNPEWFEGSTNVYDALLISNFVRSFSNSTVNNMTPPSNSASGGGWSGSSGSFGGFSGGGGGGGSSGGW